MAHRGNRAELLKVERRLADLVNNRKATSTQFKPMPSVRREYVRVSVWPSTVTLVSRVCIPVGTEKVASSHASVTRSNSGQIYGDVGCVKRDGMVY